MKSKSILTIFSAVLVVTSLLILLQAATPVTLWPAAVLATGTTWYVAPTPTGTSSSGGSCSHPGYNTISAAIAAASPGPATVNVCTGTYVEQLTISEPLILTGVGNPTIQAPTTMTADASGSMNIVTITGSLTTASLSGFTVTGPTTTHCGGSLVDGYVGIFVRDGATANIVRNTIKDITDNPLDGDQCGQGIIVGRAAFSTVGHATISYNDIFDYQKSGIVVDDTGSTAVITHNTVTGVGLTAAIGQNGIQVSSGAVAAVDSNTVSGNEYGGSGSGPDLILDTQSAGLLLYQSGSGTSVTNNAVSANDRGIVLYQASSATAVEHNILNNNRYAGIALEDGTYTASNNSVFGGNVGIAAVADASNTSVTLTMNTISGVTASIGAYTRSGLTATVLSS
jgi:parallel beta-helix repeat protein